LRNPWISTGPKRSGAAKRKRARALHAAIHNAATLVQRVMRDAAEGDDAATGHAIRLLALTHETLQPTKHEAAKGGQGPILPKFNRPTQSAPPAPPSSSVPAVEESQASMATLRLFDANTTRLLPRVPCYFDDIIGFSTGDCNGERLAISDFNTAHPIRKLSPIFGLRHFVMPPYREQPWVEMMYLTHLFDHPMYGLYDGFLRRDGSDGRPSAHLPAVRRPPRDHLAASA